MTVYINTETKEYPRHIGDVALEPDAPWEEVVQIGFPKEPPNPGKMWVEDTPVFSEGVWTQVWKEIDVVPFDDIRPEPFS